METLARPHRDRYLLAFGMVSVPAALLGVPLGMYVWYRADRHIATPTVGSLHRDAPEDIRLARRLGIGSTVLWMLVVISLATLVFLGDGLRLQQVR